MNSRTILRAVAFAAIFLPMTAGAAIINTISKNILADNGVFDPVGTDPAGRDGIYFTVPEASTVFLEITAADFGTNAAGFDNDPVLTLFNDPQPDAVGAGDRVQQAIIGGAGNFPKLSRPVTPGNYVVYVTNFGDDQGNTGPSTEEILTGTGLFIASGVANTYTLQITGATTGDGTRPDVDITVTDPPPVAYCDNSANASLPECTNGTGTGTGTGSTAGVPEPATLALLGLGLAGLGAARRRKSA